MRTHRLFIVLAGLWPALGLISGCSDDPSHEANQQAQEKTAEAMDMLTYKGDTEQVRRQLDAARSIRSSGLTRDSMYLASGNLELTESRQQAGDLELKKAPAQEELISAQEQLRRVLKLRLQQRRVQELIASGDLEIQELREVLAGSDTLPGLQKELADAQAKLQELSVQRVEWEQKEAAADSQLAALQAQADAKMHEAKTAPASQQADLEQAGYRILLQKKEYYFDKQEAVNNLQLLDDQIALVRPVIERMENYIQQTEEKIAQLQQSQELANLRTQQRQLSEHTNAELKTLKDHLSAFKKYVDQYRQASDQVLALLEEVLVQYENIRSREPQPTVLYKKAQTQSMAGSVTAWRLLFESNMSLAVEGMLRVVEEDDAILRNLLQDGFLAVPEDQLLAKAVESFDQADQTFDQALSAGSAIGGEAGRQFKLNVTKSRLLNLHAKMKLADSLDRYELATQIQGVLDEQRTKAAELGPSFTQSETARLLEKGLSYIPKMPYDSELFFESIRNQITAWRQVQGTPEQREAAARMTLQAIEQLEAEADEKMLQLLQPEKQALQQAIERGFTEATPPAPRGPAEPNSF